ncbi:MULTISPECIES: YhaI family protein [Heyndrickxia]|uniref:YhaI family protein n=1 Tax=Heyndrickxia faecalis TaxID=2824910 RepID=A0AAU7WHN3_9BACI|nr:YhaI family protein [Heyndrickxia coagulans]APB35539.1 hypothetical protein BIZ35_01185 [Heyndrickxia coagulans]QPG54339.1 YhaI family protein [Heyndrickxia coagulans]WNE62416.1 YhaI family protein [Heyndrickxia coagulans]
MESIEQKLERLEFYQTLLLKMIGTSQYPFFRLIMEKQLSKQDIEQFYALCDRLSDELKEQKADKFVFFYPLFQKFKDSLHEKLQPAEVIAACLQQGLYPELMKALKRNL